MAETEVTYKRNKRHVNKKKKNFIRRENKSNKIIDNRPKVKKIQKFDHGHRVRWQKIGGSVKCPICRIIFQIGNMPEYRCTWCNKLIWVDPGMQKGVHMTENG